MEFKGATFLYTLAGLMITFAGFSAPPSAPHFLVKIHVNSRRGVTVIRNALAEHKEM